MSSTEEKVNLLAQADAAPGEGFDPGDWKSRIINGRALGAAANPPAWLDASYETLRKSVMHPEYPCFFGTIAEKRGEMFYSFVNGKNIADLPATMQTFAELALRPEYRKNNIAIFFEPDAEPLSHDDYHKHFWQILQHLHDVDPDPKADQQPPPSDGDWEFSFAGVECFVVCACPSFRTRHSRNLGPGMVLLFQPRSVFVDTITNKVIGREARNQVRKRLETWDEISAHPDLGFYGDPGNLEWKQYFLDDANVAADDRCPFLKRQKQNAEAAQAAFGAEPRDVLNAGDYAPKRHAEPVVVQAKPAAADEAGARHWQQHRIVSTESPYAPHPASWHGKEHHPMPPGKSDRHEYGED
ncbi:YqcI/YcgG family protein [Burkholderia sp. Ac-20379]|uniref:YqcI/YcgG family protein n=1 Tax=Burkholderia sp. Ac-20379 TaxID=2703900 RepID=UPI00197CCB92|nr:YqcI/YcgG family protein [Burkholderia sp. Ac-20379]MBN3727875.1 YqcI/YcgG family protein [Burkholderia sp. Ac-20379]